MLCLRAHAVKLRLLVSTALRARNLRNRLLAPLMALKIRMPVNVGIEGKNEETALNSST